MFKRCLSLAVCLLMLSMLFAPCTSVLAAPAEKTTFTLSVTEGSVGDTVTVSMSLSENSYFTNATFYLYYDPTAVAYVEESIDTGSISPKSGTMFDVRDYAEDRYLKCAYVTTRGISKGGVLLTFDFEVLSNTPAAFSLSFVECVGVDENDSEFDVTYDIVGCVLNNDGTVEIPTGAPATTTTVITTTTNKAVTTATTAPIGEQSPTTLAGGTTTTLPTMVVTDEGNNKITIPVITTTDANGNVATVPVAVVTDAKGTTVTVPVAIVTDTAGSVATIPVATGTDENGNEVTIPVAIVTDTEGNVETVPVATATDAKGSVVTVPVTTSTTAPTEPAAQDNGLTTGIVIVVLCVIVAVVVALAAMKLRKKSDSNNG